MPQLKNTPLENLEQVKQALDLTGALVAILDRQRRIVYFNTQAQQLTGFTEDEVLGKELGEHLIRDFHRERYNTLLTQVMEGEIRSHEGFWRTKEKDNYVCIHSTLTAIEAGPNDMPWIVITGIDISARKRAEQELLYSEARLRAIHDAAIDGIITIDDKGIIQSLNNAVTTMFGYSGDELTGKNVKVLATALHSTRHDKYIANYLRTGEAKIIGIGREVTARRKDGSEFPVELAVIEIQLPRKRMFTGIIRDISERKRIEQAAHMRITEHAHASRLAALGEMASGIAHELNQPLTAIVSFADACKRLLRKEDNKLDVIERTLGEIAQQGERAGNIIRRLREFVRKGKVERQPVYANDLIDDVLKILDHDIRLQQIKVERNYSDELPSIAVDKLQIEQVVLNLLRNAIDAMENCNARFLTIETRRRDNDIIIAVADSGNGFSKQHAAQLFDAFFTTKPDGTGLGLSISQSIIAAHGGELTAESNDYGATFIIRLPLP